MSRASRIALAAFLLAIAGNASAGLGPNGLGPNGLGPNGLGPNGLGPNGLGPNGLGPNGLGPNGLGPNGLGPNGLGPNGLGPNGLSWNGLGPNGFDPNGLGPNGLIYVILPIGYTTQSTFRDWFEGTPPRAATRAERSQFMRYFARCAYDSHTAIAYVDSTGKTWAWNGQYGLAMQSLSSTERTTALGTIRGRMTVAEGRWVSACILAHVNMQGTHQYISLRAKAPNSSAAKELSQTTGEFWTMGVYHGAFFGDLFTTTPARYSCRQHGDLSNSYLLDVVLGRKCDAYDCFWTNPATQVTETIIDNLERCSGHPSVPPITKLNEKMDPLYVAETFQFAYPPALPVDYHPVFVDGPVAVELEFPPLPGWSSGYSPAYHTVSSYRDLSSGMTRYVYAPGAVAGVTAARNYGIVTPATSREFDVSQTQNCVTTGGCSPGTAPAFMDQGGSPNGRKLTGLRSGQSLEAVVRYTGAPFASSVAGLGTTPILPSVPDMSEPFTALVRFSNCRASKASASLAVSGAAGLGASIGSEIWPSTIPAGATSCANGESWEWLQVYPVQGFMEDTGTAATGVRPTLKIGLSGASQGEACTGNKLLRGDGEVSSCSGSYRDPITFQYTCFKPAEAAPACRGKLVLVRTLTGSSWQCTGGGKALYACTGADAPELDAVAFVPGKPWCAPAGATSFVGVCK